MPSISLRRKKVQAEGPQSAGPVPASGAGYHYEMLPPASSPAPDRAGGSFDPGTDSGTTDSQTSGLTEPAASEGAMAFNERPDSSGGGRGDRRTTRMASSSSFSSSSSTSGVHHKLASVFSSSSSTSSSSKSSRKSFLKRNSSSLLRAGSSSTSGKSGFRRRDLKASLGINGKKEDPSSQPQSQLDIERADVNRQQQEQQQQATFLIPNSTGSTGTSPNSYNNTLSQTSLSRPGSSPNFGSTPGASSSVVSLLSRVRQSFEDLRDVTGMVMGSNNNNGSSHNVNSGVSSAPLTSMTRSRASTFQSVRSTDTSTTGVRSPPLLPLSTLQSPTFPSSELHGTQQQSSPHSRTSSIVILSPRLSAAGVSPISPVEANRSSSRSSSRINSPLASATTSDLMIPAITLENPEHPTTSSSPREHQQLEDLPENAIQKVTFNSLYSKSIPDLSSTSTLQPGPRAMVSVSGEPSNNNSIQHASKPSNSSDKSRSYSGFGAPNLGAPPSFKERLRRKTFSMIFPDNDLPFGSASPTDSSVAQTSTSLTPTTASTSSSRTGWSNNASMAPPPHTPVSSTYTSDSPPWQAGVLSSTDSGETIDFASLSTSTNSETPSGDTTLKPKRVPLMRSLSSQEVIDNSQNQNSPTSSDSGLATVVDSEFSPKSRPRSKTVGSVSNEYKAMSASSHGSSNTSSFLPRPSFGSLLTGKLRSESESSIPFNKKSSPSPRPSFSFSTAAEERLPERHIVDNELESPEVYLVRLKETTTLGTSLVAVLSQSDQPFHREVLQLCIDNESFAGEPLDMALRKFLMHFRLPKETQQIDRVLEAFATTYHKNNPDVYVDRETTYFVVFSLVILHTDFFNKNNRHKMAKNEYVNNTRSDDVPDVVLEVSVTCVPLLGKDALLLPKQY
ncbi:Arf family guanine nucleotide exchange factor SYT1 [Sugiyamaella lignohabitans]|uniref:Arf family guanine nucleotide exchange factor SYT1 n=1 Tax=Sugiyamaella lignohabitans TaxID=796027 RepID=A0A161HK30_9ASCO|nr:Arf family guanine nucleotide exchange factor SYT1 [Sugiyamaella lignohabitans]ANB13237.1 Arf family guanine nucleotide exchange factor SYT1 [Sugiyamaella lignohabitans]